MKRFGKVNKLLVAILLFGVFSVGVMYGNYVGAKNERNRIAERIKDFEKEYIVMRPEQLEDFINKIASTGSAKSANPGQLNSNTPSLQEISKNIQEQQLNQEMLRFLQNQNKSKSIDLFP